jgi:ABC-2 type transport system permease protein
MTTTTPNVHVNGSRLGLMALHARTEVVLMRRSAEFVISTVAIPALLYAMFAMSNTNTFVPGGAPFHTLAVGSFAAYGIVFLSLFTFGSDVARERGRGWIRTLRATPVPASSYIAAKMSMGIVYALLILAAIVPLAVVAGADLTIAQWFALAGVLMIGVLAFGTVGFAIAFLARPRGATAIASLAFLPLSFASGFFFPLSELPKVIQDVAPYLPTYHFGQLVWRVVGTDADVAALTGEATQPLAVHVAWLAIAGLVGAAGALWAARRAAVTRRT